MFLKMRKDENYKIKNPKSDRCKKKSLSVIFSLLHIPPSPISPKISVLSLNASFYDSLVKWFVTGGMEGNTFPL